MTSPTGQNPYPPPYQGPRKARLGKGRIILIAISCLIVLFVGIGAIAAATGGTRLPAVSDCANVSGPCHPSDAAPSYSPDIPADTTPVTQAPAPPPAPVYTASQQSAIQDAESYLSTEPGFSKLGLAGQLEFDKFSYADASFAVNHISVNWWQQAAADASNYQTTEGGFSDGSMISQLEFDKFTYAQAAYGAKSVGL